MRRATREIAEHTAGMSREAHEDDSRTQRAVERNLQIIGEAVHRLSEGFKRGNPEIERDEIDATRNVVVHHDFGVDNAIVWDVPQEDLPLLRAVVDRILGGGRSPARSLLPARQSLEPGVAAQRGEARVDLHRL